MQLEDKAKKDSEFDFKPKLYKSKYQTSNGRLPAVNGKKSSISPAKVNQTVIENKPEDEMFAKQPDDN